MGMAGQPQQALQEATRISDRKIFPRGQNPVGLFGRSEWRAVIMRKTSTSRAQGKKNRPKIKLGIPDLEHSKVAVLRSLGSPDSRRGYQHAIDEFATWYCSEPRLALNKTVVLRYR
jgi:hypothetical protein